MIEKDAITKFWMKVYLASIKNGDEEYLARRQANRAVTNLKDFQEKDQPANAEG
jgi:hypothetical protein